jgi:hypothetical protein
MAEKRKPISKKIRFEVFKRDSFTCQYCGRMAPDVILELDHIKPVASGGNNGIMNLITSCFDCNRGKGKRELSEKGEILKQQKQLSELSERREQLKMLLEWREELLKFHENEVDIICDTISLNCDGPIKINESGRKVIKDLIRRFGIEEIIRCCEISFTKYDDIDVAFNKIGGIAYNRKYKQDKNMPAKRR